MLKTLKKSFKILKNNTIFVQPILLFMLTILSILLFLNGRILPQQSQILLLISFFLLFIAFCSGWLYINKLGVVSYNENDTSAEISEKSIKNFKKFFEGVGANFVKLLITVVILLSIYFLIMLGLTKLCLHYFGMPQIINDFRRIAQASSQAEILNITNNIPYSNMLIFMKWMLVLYPASVLIGFFSVVTCAALAFEETSLIRVYARAIKFFFKNILGCIFIIIVLKILYFIINIISMLIGVNTISLFIITMLITIYLNYYLLLVFCFYYDKTKNNSNNGTEFIG